MRSFPYILSHQAPATRPRHRHRTPSKEGTVFEEKESTLYQNKGKTTESLRVSYILSVRVNPLVQESDGYKQHRSLYQANSVLQKKCLVTEK